MSIRYLHRAMRRIARVPPELSRPDRLPSYAVYLSPPLTGSMIAFSSDGRRDDAPPELPRRRSLLRALVCAAPLALSSLAACANERFALTPPVTPGAAAAQSNAPGVVTVTGIRDLGIQGNWTSSVGVAINDAGMVAGFFAGNGFRGIPWRWSDGVFQMLPAPAGQARPTGINASGQISGGWDHSAYRWNAAGTAVTVLTEAPSSGHAAAWAINDDGVVVGTSGISGDACLACATVWPPSGGRATLGLVGDGMHAGAGAINNFGVVAGLATVVHGSPSLAAVWDGAPVSLGALPGGTTSEATDVNDRGVVVGWSAISGGTQAFIWQNGVLTPLPHLTATKDCRAYAVNEYSHVVGYCAAPSGIPRPVLWRDGTVIDLGTLAGQTTGAALDVNNFGQILGQSGSIGPEAGDSPAGRAVIWSYTVTPSDPLPPLPSRQPTIGVNAPALVDEVFLNGGEIRHRFFDITNVGTGTLNLLSIGPIQWGDPSSGIGTAGFAIPFLEGALAPARLRLTIAEAGNPFGVGVFTARVPVVSSALGVTNSPYLINVRKQVGADDAWHAFTPTAPPEIIASVGGPPPAPFVAAVNRQFFSVCGGGQLFASEVRYPAWENGGWLTATIDGFTLTLRANQGTRPVGRYTANITLNLTNGSGCAQPIVWRSFTVTLVVTNAPPNRAPVVNVGGPYTATEGSPVTFVASASDADGNPLTYQYSLGDGKSGVGLPTQHTYADNGTYTLSVTANDGITSTTSTTTVTVANAAPTATLQAPANVGSGATFPLALVSPSDPSPTDTDAGFTYRFDCGTGYSPPTTSAQVVCARFRGGSRTVRASITDKDGGTSEYTTVVIGAENGLPMPVIGTPTGTLVEGSLLSLSGAGSSDPDHDALTYEWTWGDGTSEASSSTATATHRYADNGSYTVTLRVTDAAGGSNSTTAPVVVANVAPTATLQAPASAGSGVTFPLALVSPADVSPTDVAAGFTYRFDCGTGSYGSLTPSSTAACPRFVGGSRIVRAIIADKDGGVTEYTTTVAGGNAPPVALMGTPSGQFVEGSLLSFSGAASSDPEGDALTYEWTWGDGTSESTGATPTATHRFPDNGNYTVTLRVTAMGGTSTATNVVNIANAAPTVTAFTASTDVRLGETFTLSAAAADPSSVDVTAGLQYSFACGNSNGGPVTFGPYGPSATTTCPALTANGQRTIAVSVRDKDGATTQRTAEVWVQQVINIAPQTISLSTTGTVSVYLYGSSTFDPRAAVPSLVRLRVVGGDPLGAAVSTRNGAYMATIADYNGDGRPDQLFVFTRASLQAAGLTTTRTAMVFENKSASAQAFEATDPTPPTITP